MKTDLNITPTIRVGVIGVWLTILYIVSIAIALLAFAAFQFQSGLAAIDGGGQRLTIGQIESERRSYANRLLLFERSAEIARALEADFLSSTERFNEARSLSFEYEAKLESIKDEALTILSAIQPTITGDQVFTKFDNEANPNLRELQQAISARSAFVPSEDEARLLDLLKRLQEMASQQYALGSAFAIAREHKSEIQDSLNDARDNIARSSDSLHVQSDLIGLFQQMDFFDQVIFGRVFATMPPSLLIPVVTLAMGALGSVIYLSVGIVTAEPKRPFYWYVFRPMLGMVTAFAVFILVQAGALVATQPSVGSGPDQLNPYFIAFVAIISGLLSEQAVERMRSAAQNFFRSDDKSTNDEKSI